VREENIDWTILSLRRGMELCHCEGTQSFSMVRGRNFAAVRQQNIYWTILFLRRERNCATVREENIY